MGMWLCQVMGFAVQRASWFATGADQLYNLGDMRLLHVAIALVISVGSPHVARTADETLPSFKTGLQLAELTLAVGKATSLPEVYAALGSQVLRTYYPDDLAEDLSGGGEVARRWLQETPEGASWVERLFDVRAALEKAEQLLGDLPQQRLSSLSEQNLAPTMESLRTVRKTVESLDEALHEKLLTDAVRWEFQIAFLSRSLADELPFPLSITEEEIRFLAETIPSDLPENARRSVEELLDLLPVQAGRGAVQWTNPEQREHAAQLARSILMTLESEYE